MQKGRIYRSQINIFIILNADEAQETVCQMG